MLRIVLLVAVLGLPASVHATSRNSCLSTFDQGVANARVAEACDWVRQLESCLGDLPLAVSGTEKDALIQAEGVLGANQIKFGCPEPQAVKRRETAMTTNDGNVNIDVDASRDFHVTRVSREAVNILAMNDGIESAEADSKAAAGELAQLQIDIAAEIADITKIRSELTAHSDATVSIAQLGERVANLDSLVSRVNELSKQVALVADELASTQQSLQKSADDVAEDIADDHAAFETALEAKISSVNADVAAAEEAVKNNKLSADTMPIGSVVQSIDKKVENQGGSACSDGFCVSTPHYGNNLNAYRKVVPCFIEITAVRKNSHFFAEFSQAWYTGTGSHNYLDVKRSVAGGSEKSMLAEYRKSSLTDELVGMHPSGGDGYQMQIVFLDSKANALKDQTVKYQLWYATWGGGQGSFSGYKWNNNERSLNWYTLQEIAT